MVEVVVFSPPYYDHHHPGWHISAKSLGLFVIGGACYVVATTTLMTVRPVPAFWS